MAIEEAVYSILTGTPAVSQVVGTRIYPTQAPADAAFPLCVYQEAEQQFVMTYEGPRTTSRYVMDLTCWSDSYASAKLAARRIKTALNGYRGRTLDTRILGIFDQTESDDSEIPQHGDERGLFAVSMSLLVWHKSTGV